PRLTPPGSGGGQGKSRASTPQTRPPSLWAEAHTTQCTRMISEAVSPAVDLRSGPIELVARCKIDGTRLDQYLVSLFPDYSRSVVQRVIVGGGVTVNGAIAKASHRIRHGDAISIRLPAPTHPLPVAEDIPLETLV